MQCSRCNKKLNHNYEVFGKVGETLCLDCHRDWNRPPTLLLAESYVYTCASCGTWAFRVPKFLDDDGYWQCDKCGSSTLKMREGRPYGPKSRHWEWIENQFDQIVNSLPGEFLEGVKTDPPLEANTWGQYGVLELVVL